ncbi:MAG: CRISPR-associated endonuclease Cas2 [Clostridiales bacterium]|nr:CRISPR-associated endonuclease Cas2 [Clostridiales bacterium]
MFVILAYDINKKRVAKVLRICRKYLVRVQNSSFEGTITESGLRRLQRELKNAIVPEEDTVVIYELDSCKYVYKYEIGIQEENSSVI